MSTTTTPLPDIDALAARLLVGHALAVLERFRPRSWAESREAASKTRMLVWTRDELAAGKLAPAAAEEIAGACLAWGALEGASVTAGYGARGTA